MLDRPPYALHSAVGFAIFAIPAMAQESWSRVLVPGARAYHASAFDSTRGETMVFGGYTDSVPGSSRGYAEGTWLWNGTAWRRAESLLKPDPRVHSAMAFHESHQHAVLFGGYRNGNYGDTWVWDGAQWHRRTPTHAPTSRYGMAMVYDAARGRTVLFGGYTSGYVGDTWEWDGNDWIVQSPVVAPPPRHLHAMAYDPVRRMTVLFGGNNRNGLNDTWEWDGVNWAQRSAATPPSARWYASMAFDPARQALVLVGGTDAAGALADEWSWDGTAWTSLGTSVLAARSGSSLALDEARGVVVGFGGEDSGHHGDTWELDAAGWSTADPDVPAARQYMPLVDDTARQRLVMFGGQFGNGGAFDDTTWEWDGSRWWRVAPSGSRPTARHVHAMAFDRARGEVVLFGGHDGASLADTWTWNGTTWTQRTPATSPPATHGAAMAYDVARQRVVLFGGSTYTSDTWEWDGSDWSMVTAVGPARRAYAAMVYDEARAQIVLFGGRPPNSNSTYADTWTWDGVAWTRLSPSPSPPSRGYHGFTYDAGRAVAVMHGGWHNSSSREDTWEWDGAAWNQCGQNKHPSARYAHSMAYDRARERVVLFGGHASLADAWLYFNPNPARFDATHGAGCTWNPSSTSRSTLDSLDSQLPWLGRTFELRLSNLAPSSQNLLTLGFQPTALSLAAVGRPGCTLWLLPQITVPMAVVGGSGQAATVLPIPTASALVGQRFYVQAITTVFAFPPQISVSNAGLATIGRACY